MDGEDLPLSCRLPSSSTADTVFDDDKDVDDKIWLTRERFRDLEEEEAKLEILEQCLEEDIYNLQNLLSFTKGENR